MTISDTTEISSVYIAEPANSGWIIERLIRALAQELKARGISTAVGPTDGYGGQDVLFNSRFLTAAPDSRARVNSMFITHVDDRLRESELRASLSQFNSLVCLSAHDADFIAGLNGDRSGVVGIDLPAFSANLRPVRLALFTARYPDGRKNEQWLLEYFKERPAVWRDSFVLCFMGWDWETFCVELASLNVNYEVYRYSRDLPGEYTLYK
jgi:hypothetical protein